MEKIQTHKTSPEVKKDKVYLYHMVPEDMHGSVLHPLNKLKETNPDLYLAKASKYHDRRHVIEHFIPTLQCAWNDVLHFTAINPEELKKALTEAGFHPHEMKFYQVDPELLDPNQTTIYLYQDRAHSEPIPPHDFSKYDPEKLGDHSILPEITKEYYREKHEKDERPLLFVGVPHILHKGSIDISNLPIIVV